MSHELKFQDPGEGIHEGEIVDVLVSVGDTVHDGDDVLVIETDKATTDLPSPFSGTVEEIRVDIGDVVEVGDVMMTFSDAGEGSEAAEDEQVPEETASSQAEESESSTREPHREKEEKEKKKRKKEKKRRQKDEEKPKRRSGGKAAAVGELPEYEEKDKKREKKASEKPRPEEREAAERPVPASPATRRLARELGVDLAEIEPSGPHGRVLQEDVRAAAEGDQERPARERERPALPDFERWGPIERQPLRGIRRATARRMMRSWQEIPHVTHHEQVDITELERWRRKKAAQVEASGARLSLLVLVMKALASTLTRHPRFNASLDPDSDELILKHYCHLGVAVDTDEGLVVGVVRDVDRLSITSLADAVDQMVERVRNREVDAEELQGSTFTVTNIGPLGGVAFEPLVNHPEVAILGMARASLQQVVSGDLDAPRTSVRYMLPLSLAYDHRVNDGGDAARFLNDLSQALHDPDAFLLNI